MLSRISLPLLVALSLGFSGVDSATASPSGSPASKPSDSSSEAEPASSPRSAQKQGQVSTLAEVDAGSGGLELDAAGDLYSSDFGAVLGDPSTAGTKVWRISSSGATSVFAEGFSGASGNAFDSEGFLFQANIRGNTIDKISPDGEVTKFAEEGLANPVGLVFDDKGNLFVANCGGASIQRIEPSGKSTRFVGSQLLACPNGITIDEAGNLYTSNFYNGNVVKVTPEGKASVLATVPGNNNGHLAYSKGRLLVVGRGAHQIFSVSLSGDVEVIAGSGEKGGADGPAHDASFCFPNDIAVSPDGRTIYINEVADESSLGRKLAPTRIRKIVLPAD